MPSERALGKLSVERTLIRCVFAFVPCSCTVLHNLQSVMQDNGVGEPLLSAAHRRCMICCMTYLEELDCTCSFMKEWKTIQSSPKECFLLRRKKDNPRNPNYQAPRLHLLYDRPPHTTLRTLQAVVGGTTNWREEKASKKAEQAKEEKGWKNNGKKLCQRDYVIERQKKSP